MSLIAELQRRSVFKVGAAYLLVAWLLIQVAATVAPQLGLPPWVPRFVTLVLLLGFPVALVLAWAFELTPEGVKVDARGAGTKRVLAVAGVLALAAVVWWARGGGPAPVAAGVVADSRSIAVLPFENMSGDADNQFFSDGIAEEILNSLAQMPGLKVAARTSSFSFRGQNKEIPDIARELEVRMVLEGSVRKQGERVRITAQLIDAERGFHVWSRTYDRELKDIFAIQGEIAQAIAQELEVKLSAAQRDGLATADTADLEAYDLYLKGMQLWQARGSENVQAAERALRAALERDPKFAKAWAGLAVTLTVLPEWTVRERGPSWLAARDAAEHAIALDPTLPEPYTTLGYIAMSEFRWATGRAMFERVHALAPSYATAWQWHGESLAVEGDLAESIVVLRRGVQLDPKSTIVRQALVNMLFFMGREHEAMALCEQLLRERPDWLACLDFQFSHALLRGEHAAAARLLQAMAAPRGPQAVAFAARMGEALEARRAPRDLVAQMLELNDGTSDTAGLTPLADFDLMMWAIAVGRPDAALDRFIGYATRLPHAARPYFYTPAVHALACDPRYAALARQLAVPDAVVAANCAAGKDPYRPAPPPPRKS